MWISATLRSAPIYSTLYPMSKPMTASDMGKKGIAIVNKMLTPEKRKLAAKKGWRKRRAKLKDKK